MQRLRHGLAAVFLAAVTLIAPAAHADLSSVVVSPSSANVGLNGATLSLIWTVNRVGPVAGGAATTSSPSATLVVNGQVLQTSGSLFTSTTTIAPGASQVLTFTETFTISAAIAHQIARGTAGSATINRTFTDTSAVPTITQSVRVALNTGAAGAISVRRIDLAFDDGNRTRVIARGNPLRAIGNLRFQGGGIFAGEWRVSVQDGVRGSGFERRLAIIRQPLSGAGNGATRLVSPPLPVDGPGLYQVRLVPDASTTGLSIPAIRYRQCHPRARAGGIGTPGGYASDTGDTLCLVGCAASGSLSDRDIRNRQQAVQYGSECPAACRVRRPDPDYRPGRSRHRDRSIDRRPDNAPHPAG